MTEPKSQPEVFVMPEEIITQAKELLKTTSAAEAYVAGMLALVTADVAGYPLNERSGRCLSRDLVIEWLTDGLMNLHLWAKEVARFHLQVAKLIPVEAGRRRVLKNIDSANFAELIGLFEEVNSQALAAAELLRTTGYDEAPEPVNRVQQAIEAIRELDKANMGIVRWNEKKRPPTFSEFLAEQIRSGELPGGLIIIGADGPESTAGPAGESSG